MMDGFVTGTTCNAACWEAREEECRCSCGGRNHGIAKRGDTPTRTTQRTGDWYELEAIEPSFHEASMLCYDPNWRRPRIRMMERATKAQMKWPELESFDDRDRPYLIWKRTVSPVEISQALQNPGKLDLARKIATLCGDIGCEVPTVIQAVLDAAERG